MGVDKSIVNRDYDIFECEYYKDAGYKSFK